MMRFALIGIMVATCSKEPPPPQPVAAPQDPCALACGKLLSTGCPEAQPNPIGQSCVDVCRNETVLLDAACVAKSSSISEIRACNVRCQGR